MMTTGMLWMDDDPKRSFDDKVKRAELYYVEKYGVKPTDCFVNSGQLPPETLDVNGVKLHGSKQVSLHHFWIGVDGQSPKPVQKSKD